VIQTKWRTYSYDTLTTRMVKRRFGLDGTEHIEDA